MATLDEMIRLAIEKNLPSEVSTALQQRLKKADDDAKIVEGCKELLKLKCSQILELEKKLVESQSLHKTQVELEKDRADLQRAEDLYKLRVAEDRLEMEKEKTAFLTKTMHLLLGNRIIRENIQTHAVCRGADSVQWNNGGQIAVSGGSYTTPVTETKETEQK